MEAAAAARRELAEDIHPQLSTPARSTRTTSSLAATRSSTVPLRCMTSAPFTSAASR